MNPFFIIGNPRSGTTMLRLMLNGHPQICVPPECGFIEWWYEKYSGWNKRDSIDVSKIDECVNDILSSRKMETWHIKKIELKKNILIFIPNNYADLCEIVCLTFAQSKNKFGIKRWGDKNNYYVQKCERLYAIFPQAQFVLIVRDGRDVACSYKNIEKLETSSIYKPKLPHKIEEIANEWLVNNQIVLKFFDTLPAQQKYILQYEKLITDTEKELNRICKYIGVDFNEEMLNYYVHNKYNQEEPAELIDWKKKTMESPDPTNLGKFKNELLPEEINSFNSIAESMLRKFNYAM